MNANLDVNKTSCHTAQYEHFHVSHSAKTDADFQTVGAYDLHEGIQTNSHPPGLQRPFQPQHMHCTSGEVVNGYCRALHPFSLVDGGVYSR